MKKIRRIAMVGMVLFFEMCSTCFASSSDSETFQPDYWIVYLVFGLLLLIGFLFLCIGIGVSKNGKKKLARCTATTMGKVVNISSETIYTSVTEPEAGLFYPVFEYTVDDKKYVKKYKFGTSEQKYEIGQEVEIHYDPNNCDVYYVGDNKVQSKLGKIFTAVGATVIVLGIITATVVCTILAISASL